MATPQQLRGGVKQVLGAINQGWNELRDRATHSLTRFSPTHVKIEQSDHRISRHTSRWGVLPVDTREDATHVYVKLEIPGVEAKTLQISVRNGDLLLVKGEKHRCQEDTLGELHVVECAYGCFQRPVQLPHIVNAGSANIDYKHGILRITFEKDTID